MATAKMIAMYLASWFGFVFGAEFICHEFAD
jgi:hypothetical protein